MKTIKITLTSCWFNSSVRGALFVKEDFYCLLLAMACDAKFSGEDTRRSA